MKSSGDLVNDRGNLADKFRQLLSLSRGEDVQRLSVHYPDHSYIVTQSIKNVTIVKTDRQEISNTHHDLEQEPELE